MLALEGQAVEQEQVQQKLATGSAKNTPSSISQSLPSNKTSGFQSKAYNSNILYSSQLAAKSSWVITIRMPHLPHIIYCG